MGWILLGASIVSVGLLLALAIHYDPRDLHK